MPSSFHLLELGEVDPLHVFRKPVPRLEVIEDRLLYNSGKLPALLGERSQPSVFDKPNCVRREVTFPLVQVVCSFFADSD
jgi:hypothetical protein